MHSDSTILLRPENWEKLPIGPTMSRPGPMLDSVASTAVKFVSKLKPSIETISVANSSVKT